METAISILIPQVVHILSQGRWSENNFGEVPDPRRRRRRGIQHKDPRTKSDPLKIED